MENYQEEEEFFKKITLWSVIVVFIISMAFFLISKSVKVIDSTIIHYEEFQETYNTCQKLNTDLCNMKDIPENDKMFKQFSKTQRLNTIKTNLNRRVEDYNSKSKMWNRSLWKSNELPYQLSLKQFNCY